MPGWVIPNDLQVADGVEGPDHGRSAGKESERLVRFDVATAGARALPYTDYKLLRELFRAGALRISWLEKQSRPTVCGPTMVSSDGRRA